MANDTRLTSIISVVVVGSLFWMMLIFADKQDTAPHTAIKFIKAYYNLDPSMADLICDDQKILDDVDVVEAYIYAKSQDAGRKGFGQSWEKSAVYQIKIEPVPQDTETVRYKISAVTRKSIHPVFAWVANLFAIGESHPVVETVDMIQENGVWKVCGTFFTS